MKYIWKKKNKDGSGGARKFHRKIFRRNIFRRRIFRRKEISP